MIRKAIVPVAGLGTRLLPLTKSLPKEMLPVGRLPTIHHVIDELTEAGIDEIFLVTARHKRAIEDYFDPDPELDRKLRDTNRAELADTLQFPGISFTMARQSTPAGNGDAVRLARSFMGTDSALMAWGDAIISSPTGESVVSRMIDVHERTGAACTIAVEEVPLEKVSRYGIVHPVSGPSEEFAIDDIVEKPDLKAAPSRFAVSARYICAPEIMNALDRTVPGHGGEIWLVDAIKTMLQDGLPVWCVNLGPESKRYDIGSPMSYWEACVDFALADVEDGALFRTYLKSRV
ncbi:MAG: NTP transferase domain-containing protein [Candidatus Latescibacteria bacterium]|nr:NTP transferase domain-containing protein [Candidatus Latescibacterota bacterium]